MQKEVISRTAPFQFINLLALTLDLIARAEIGRRLRGLCLRLRGDPTGTNFPGVLIQLSGLISPTGTRGAGKHGEEDKQRWEDRSGHDSWCELEHAPYADAGKHSTPSGP